MAKPSFPDKIWDGTSDDRKRRDFKRSPSPADYEQLVVEIQALQIQMSALLQQLKVTPVLSMDAIIKQVLQSGDQKYLSLDAPIAKAQALPRIPNTFFWVNEQGIGVGLSPEAFREKAGITGLTVEEVLEITDSRYMSKDTVMPTEGMTQVQADARYMPKNTVLFTKAQADSLYMPKSTVLFTKAQADTLYAPITLVATVQSLPTYSAADARYKLKGEK